MMQLRFLAFPLFPDRAFHPGLAMKK